MNAFTLANFKNLQALLSLNIKMFKEIILPDKKQKIIEYVLSWNDLKKATSSLMVWENKHVIWFCHTFLLINTRKCNRNFSTNPC